MGAWLEIIWKDLKPEPDLFSFFSCIPLKALAFYEEEELKYIVWSGKMPWYWIFECAFEKKIHCLKWERVVRWTAIVEHFFLHDWNSSIDLSLETMLLYRFKGEPVITYWYCNALIFVIVFQGELDGMWVLRTYLF